MNDNNNIVSLPDGFDGTFRFTNFTDEEFIGKWGGTEYIFPPQATTPIVIPTATPFEIQNIRKKFARELAVLEFYKTEKFKRLDGVPVNPALYTESDLQPFVQKCLEPLPAGQVRMRNVPKDNESKFRKDEKGQPLTKVLDDGQSLVGDGTVIA